MSPVFQLPHVAAGLVPAVPVHTVRARATCALTAVVLTIAPAHFVFGQRADRTAAGNGSIRIPFEKYTLANGLNVVMSEDRSTPTVAVEVIYHVGSKNELVGHTGFAHLFEHVMFTGSGHVPYGLHDKFTEGVGGSNNGQTYFDWTRYWETDPSNYLETALWLESDRMGFLLDSLSDAKFRAQRDIVKNERRESYDNQPYGRDREVIGYAMYPQTNPYSWPTIGRMQDLTNATVEDVKRFFRLYYAPSNATLVIVGDFDPAKAKAWVAKYFSDIPRGEQITRPTVGPAALHGEKRLTLEDRVQVPRLFISWPSANRHSADQPPLDLLSDILGGSRISRITKALVYDAQSATAVSVYQNPSENTGQFEIIVTPRPGHTLTEIETQVDSVLDGIKRDGPSADELRRVKAGQQLDFIRGLQSNLGKALELGEDQTYFNDPSYTFRVEYPETQGVTAADIERVANRYLGSSRVVLSTVPLGHPELAAHADRSTVVTDPFTENSKAQRSEVKP